MFEKLPIFEAFDRGASFAEMADVLKRMPFSIAGRYAMTLRNRLMIRGFPEGIAYLDAKIAFSAKVLEEDGWAKPEALRDLSFAGFALSSDAKVRDAARAAKAEGGDE